MARLRLSAKAGRDLKRIGNIGAEEHGAAASERYVEGFRRYFRLLQAQPLAGQARPELGADVRSLSHRPHRILYHVEGDVVVIDRILHQARDIQRALRDEH